MRNKSLQQSLDEISFLRRCQKTCSCQRIFIVRLAHFGWVIVGWLHSRDRRKILLEQ